MSKQDKDVKGYQFGTFQGVFTPSILTILGVIMYLRFGWVLGNVGLIPTLVIVTMAVVVTLITTLSISQFATNMRIGVGGAYYIISRSLGVEAGAAIGIPLFFAKALGVSFYIAGFSESIVGLFPSLSIKFVGVVTLTALTILAYFSADLALKAQYIILVVIGASLVSFFTGSYTPVETASSAVLNPPLVKSSFWLVFAIFFPAVTGIEAGLSMSGDLKNPEKSLPYGTIAAILVSYVIYMAIPIFLKHLNVSDYDLINNNLLMKDIASVGMLIIYGLWAASISSALGALLGAPRTLQAMANDGVVFRFIGRGFGKENDPRIATLICFIVALLGILLGDLNAIATILTMFFLVSYGLLNLAAGFEGLISNPSWRPKFKVHWSFSMLGAIFCLMIMMMISPGATIISTTVIIVAYFVMQRRKLNAYWGDMKYGILMLFIRVALYKLAEKKPHEKTWRPNLLVFSGAPSSRFYLVEIADSMSQGKGFLTVATILSKEAQQERIVNMEQAVYEYLKKRCIPAIVKVITAENFVSGMQTLVHSYGFGSLVPNTILIGQAQSEQNFIDHAKAFQYVYRAKKNLVVVREPKQEVINKKAAQIDLWWSHLGDNAGLMLALAYLVKTSSQWEGSKLVIKSIVKDEEEKIKQLEYFNSFIKKENIEAEVDIYVKDENNAFDLILKNSQNSDLVFMGMRPVAEDESFENYGQYYKELVEKTKLLSSVIFVLAAEEINFGGIFKLRDAH